jgi:hypothetical protein
MRVYIAGASAEPERVRAAMGCARAAGLDVTFDWLAMIEAAGAANEGLDDEQRKLASRLGLCAVEAADIVWLLAPEAPSCGVWVELGYALGHGISVIVSGRARVRCIFAALATEFDDDDRALEHIVELAEWPRLAPARAAR